MAHIGTLVQQIDAIESANINKGTLEAMERASQAMKTIHGKLTVDKVDQTMYVTILLFYINQGQAYQATNIFGLWSDLDCSIY
jgi:hypothetical protein